MWLSMHVHQLLDLTDPVLSFFARLAKDSNTTRSYIQNSLTLWLANSPLFPWLHLRSTYRAPK